MVQWIQQFKLFKVNMQFYVLNIHE